MTKNMPQNTALDRDGLNQWLIEQGLRGTSRSDLLQGYCERLIEMGIPLLRLHVAQSAFHPKFGGIGFDWLRNGGLTYEHYEIAEEPPIHWVQSPFYHLMSEGLGELYIDLIHPRGQPNFPILDELRKLGGTGYYLTGVDMSGGDIRDRRDPTDPREGMLISWTTDQPGGLTTAQRDTLQHLLPCLALALKAASNRRMASDLLEVYLGRDAGRRVLSGSLGRGSLQNIGAVILFFDLSGFTRLAEQTPGDQLIAMLNDYYGLVVAEIEARGGAVLKFMGDGLLAMFQQDEAGEAVRAGLDTATVLRKKVDQKNAERRAAGEPVTDFTLALHAGEILYGNIGAESRLDFTAIGPAVNLTARLSGMHRAVGQDVILSQPVFEAATAGQHDLVSLGRYMLRGVSEPQELFTIHAPG